jgi:hypothetical protein
MAPNSGELQKSLTFDPIYLTNGIQLSDEPFVALRSAVCALSVAPRRRATTGISTVTCFGGTT